MKTTILLILGLIISFACFSQKNKDLTFVPRGNFKINDAGSPKTISVDDFWMSNEISNKEFRHFFNQIKNSPNDSIEWLDFSSMQNDKTNIPNKVKEAYSDILDKLMTESAWRSITENGDYFTNSIYDNFPVVGVTFEGAKYYCIWRTKEEKKKNEVLQISYRLPTEYEWEYASTFEQVKPNCKNIETLHQVQKGDKNKLGLFNFKSNVAEWTTTPAFGNNLEHKVVKGNSFKFETNAPKRNLVISNEGTDYVGFRIAKSKFK